MYCAPDIRLNNVVFIQQLFVQMHDTRKALTQYSFLYMYTCQKWCIFRTKQRQACQMLLHTEIKHYYCLPKILFHEVFIIMYVCIYYYYEVIYYSSLLLSETNIGMLSLLQEIIYIFFRMPATRWPQLLYELLGG